jgi:beta-glucanase (GH16 family)
MNYLVNRVLLMLIILPGFSCSDEKTVNTDDPSNLMVNIVLSDDGKGLAVITAYADNAVKYELRIGKSESPDQENATGIFEYKFIQSGTYTIDVRAYGLSGRYLREVVPLTVSIGKDNVSIEDGYITPLTYEGYGLVWNDEFEGGEIESSNWVFETGTGCPNLCGWGNNELQYYRKENASVSGGALTIEARKESYQGSDYTSTRMKTQGKRSFQYGRIDIRALLPKGQGIWPALWMLGNNIQTVGWPKCGELDIMEMIGGKGRENQVHGTLHWDLNGHVSAGNKFTLDSGTFADEYHVFSIIWDNTSIIWYVNDIKFSEIDITPSHMTEFHHEFFLIFNVAVGGRWPGSPDETTIFPQQMKVDYIRVFQKE